ncbi:uncharacterized protein DUF4255 [Paenibacillus cellulosilyticus]|uniref:Uncharacterized protein DUF4255 n=1 Tax=Paenibacillus cellulosilyticus TaxID=375489 RepID=A0A2V2YMZ6_9BACL|nr:DUF4255 domain-containing protein [Paenibacillus cellulosilyticus]PWV95665.1 uncharacterized protein DUF4255 [Paenibacillus cellulosilyticus]QKS47700.1 DUF4255 domain-containing protein [Paenibacillus cellulosilyticus]
MAADSAIADVGESLLKLLQDGMSDLVQPSTIVLLSPADVEGQNVSLTLFLYYIAENPHLKNEPPSYSGSGRQPLAIDLYYMLTAYTSVQDIRLKAAEEQRVLGRAMRLLHENTVLRGSKLQGSLSGTDEVLRVTMNPLALTELTSIWHAIPKQFYRPSVGYVVSPLLLEAAQSGAEAARVRERTFTAGIRSEDER